MLPNSNDKLLLEVKKRVDLLSYEDPTTRVQDAIAVAKRAGILHAYASNGLVWELNWDPKLQLRSVMEDKVCQTICDRIILVLPERPSAPRKKRE